MVRLSSSFSTRILQSPLSHSQICGMEHPLIVQHSQTTRNGRVKADGKRITPEGASSTNGSNKGDRDMTSFSVHRSFSKSHCHSFVPGSASKVNRTSFTDNTAHYSRSRAISRLGETCGFKANSHCERRSEIISCKEGITLQRPYSISCSIPQVEIDSPQTTKKTPRTLSSKGNSRKQNGWSKGQVKRAWVSRSGSFTKPTSGRTHKVFTSNDSRISTGLNLLSVTDRVATTHISPSPSSSYSATCNKRLPSARQGPVDFPHWNRTKLRSPLSKQRQNTATATASKGWSRGGIRQLQLRDIAAGLGRMRYRNVVVMSGAGISTPSGIPDFRTPGTGLYDNLQKYQLPEPSAVFDSTYFHHNPRPFFSLAKELYPGKFSPNLVHCFVRLLQDKGVLLRSYTQNIDGLERLAGVQGGKLVEAHGSFSTASCTHCHSKQDPHEVKKAIFSDHIPKCKHKYCNGVVKPDVVFFGEDLPQRFHSFQLPDFTKCDLLLVMGTSLEVEPFASLVTLSRHTVPRLLLNRERVGPFRSSRCRHTDVMVEGDVVESVRVLVQGAGWVGDLESIQRTVSKEAGLCTAPQQVNSPPTSAASSNDSTVLATALQKLTLQDATHRPPSPDTDKSSSSSSYSSSTSSLSSDSSSN